MTIEELDQLGFLPVGRIVETRLNESTKVGFEFQDGLSREPHVYLWADVSEPSQTIVLYCGRAGKGLKKRMSQHVAGFQGPPKGSSSGKRKHDFLLSQLVLGRKIQVWARVSNDPKQEELALIQLFASGRNHWLVLNSILPV
jgi:hypothetical protein